MNDKIWTLQELKEAKIQYKESYKKGTIDEKTLNSALAKIQYNIRKLNPEHTERITVSSDEFVYNNHKKLGYSVGTISKHCHMSQPTIQKKIDSYQEKLDFEEFKRSRLKK